MSEKLMTEEQEKVLIDLLNEVGFKNIVRALYMLATYRISNKEQLSCLLAAGQSFR